MLALLLPVCVFASDAVTERPFYSPDVLIAGFRAVAETDGSAGLRWTTGREFGAGVFVVRRLRLDGVEQRSEIGTVRMRGDEDGGEYACADPGAREGAAARYALAFAPRGGGEQVVAEWEGVIDRLTSSRLAVQSAGPTTANPVPAAAPRPWIGNGPRVRTWTEAAPADRVRMSLRQAGLYRVTARELADAGGWDEASTAAAVAATNLHLSCRGEPVAWLAEGDALLFHGLPAASRYAPENVYWIAPGPGTAMAPQPAALPPGAATNAWFAETLTFQGTDYLARVSYSALADAPAPYVAFSGLLLSGGRTSHTVALPDCAPGVWEGSVTVNLLSYCEAGTDDHQARISLGGETLGTASWTGERYMSFVFPFCSTNAAAGTAVLTLENTAPAPPWDIDDYTRFICVSFEIAYRRLHRARGNALRCNSAGEGLVAATGFAAGDILALDVTDPAAPCALHPVAVAPDEAVETWTAVFADSGTGRVYQVCSLTHGVLEPAVRGVRDSDLTADGSVPEYAILIPPEAWRGDFRAALQPLADHRNARGLRTAILDVESLYNAFSDGLADPLAIQRFCAAAHPRGLAYLLLAGGGSLDFQHLRLSVNDSPACLIPTRIAGQRFATGEGMTVALDAALGDADGDGRPEVAVGRLPASRTADLAVAVAKTIAYEAMRLRRGPVFLTADYENSDWGYYPFGAGTDRLLAPLAAAGKRVIRCHLTSSTDGARAWTENLLPALHAGTSLFHFFGHTNEQSLGGGENRLLYYHHILESNWQKPAIAVVLGCRPNRWQALTSTSVILPYGLFAGNTGFAACMGATGYMLGAEGESLAVALYEGPAPSRTPRLGDMLLRGLRACAGTMPDERLLSFSLIGDPALETGAAAGTVLLFR